MKFILKLESSELKKSLENKSVLITRSVEQSFDDIKLLEDNGADVIAFPTIQIVPVENYSLLHNAFDSFNNYDYLIFTSANAVIYFSEELLQYKTNIDFEHVQVVAIGAKTMEKCGEYDIQVNAAPEPSNANGIINLVKSRNITDKNILIPCSVLNRDELERGLKELGAVVTTLNVYNNVKPETDALKNEIEKINNKKPDIFIFTSPSSFNNYLDLLYISTAADYFENKFIAAIGNTTKEAIERTGLNVDLVPEKYNVQSIVEKLIDKFTITDVTT